MRLRFSGAIPEPESATIASTVSIRECGHAQPAASRHGFLCIQQQVQEDLLQLSGIAVDCRQLLRQFDVQLDLGGLELMLKQRKRIANSPGSNLSRGIPWSKCVKNSAGH